MSVLGSLGPALDVGGWLCWSLCVEESTFRPLTAIRAPAIMAVVSEATGFRGSAH